MTNIKKIDAIISLVPNAQVIINGDEITWIEPLISPITDNEIDAELIRLQAEYNSKEYQRQRAAEYPSLAEQFDLLYHGGYDAWKAVIQDVKDKYPKGAE